jgi:hypothetical protein
LKLTDLLLSRTSFLYHEIAQSTYCFISINLLQKYIKCKCNFNPDLLKIWCYSSFLAIHNPWFWQKKNNTSRKQTKSQWHVDTKLLNHIAVWPNVHHLTSVSSYWTNAFSPLI